MSTSLSEKEELILTILESIGDAVIVVDSDGLVTRMNSEAERLTGWTMSEALGQPVLGIFRQLNRTTGEDVESPVLKVLSSEMIVGRNQEVVMIGRDGLKRSVSTNASPILDRNDTLLGALLIFRDNTEEIRLQEQLHQSQKLEAIGRLAGSIAHDFNNLLTAILGNAELAMLDLDDRSGLEGNLQEIQGTAVRATQLTRQLLVFGRRQAMRMSLFGLDAMISGQQKQLKRALGKDFDLVIELHSDPMRIHADQDQLEEVLMNLVQNSGEAMPDGGTIIIRTSRTQLTQAHLRRYTELEVGEYVVLTVADSGSGMTPEVREHMFEPFFTTKTKEKVAGLGLATVYGVIRQSGGDFEVESTPGEGTTFTLLLPAREEKIEQKEELLPQTIVEGDGERILVVEDEKSVRHLVVRILTRYGFSVIDAPSASAALSILAQNGADVDLVLTDVVMPEISGVDFARELSGLYPTLKVLFMTGYSPEDIRGMGIELGSRSYIQKPFSPANLVQTIQDALKPEPSSNDTP